MAGAGVGWAETIRVETAESSSLNGGASCMSLLWATSCRRATRSRISVTACCSSAAGALSSIRGDRRATSHSRVVTRVRALATGGKMPSQCSAANPVRMARPSASPL